MSINPCVKCKNSYNKKGLIGFSCGYCGLVIDYVNNTIHNPPTIPNPEPILLHKTEDGISICSICKTTSLEEKMKQIRMIEPCEWLNDYTNFKEYMEICDECEHWCIKLGLLRVLESDKYCRCCNDVKCEWCIGRETCLLKYGILDIPNGYVKMLMRENEITDFINLTFAEKQEQMEIHNLYLVNEKRKKLGIFE